jgi:transposase InsO family protein
MDSLSAVMALKMALKSENPKRNLIHHSDRGIQYCSHSYTNILLKKNVKISMTQSGSPYDNAIAERINGILKHELIYPFGEMNTMADAEKRINNAVMKYNKLRLHQSVNYQTPNSAHQNCQLI